MLSAMLRATLTLASFLSCLSAQGDDQVVAVRSLQAFRTPSLQRGAQPAFDHRADGNSLPRDASARADSVEPGWLLPFLEHRHAAALQRGDLTLVGDDNSVALRGEKAAVNACLADLDAIAAALCRTIEVTAYRLPVPTNGLPSSYSDQKSLRTRLMAGQPLWTATATTRPGGAVQLGDARWTSMVRDVDAEVAEEASIYDPQVEATFRGARVAVTAHALPGGDLLLHGSWRVATGDAAAEVPTGGDRPNVQTATRRTSYLTFAGRVRSGDGLLVGAREEGEDGLQFVLAVHARYLGPPAPPANDLLVFPASAWHATVDASFSLRAGPLAGEEPGDRPPVQELPVLSPRNLAPLLGAGEGEAAMHGPTLIVDASNAACARAEAALRQLADAQVHNAELRFVRKPESGQSRLEFVQPLLAGVPAHAFLGRTRDYVADFNVEVAKKATAANPLVSPVRDGIWSRVLGDHRGQQWFLEGLWRQSLALSGSQLQLGGAAPMTMTLPDYLNKTWPWDGRMPSDEPQVLETGFEVTLSAR